MGLKQEWKRMEASWDKIRPKRKTITKAVVLYVTGCVVIYFQFGFHDIAYDLRDDPLLLLLPFLAGFLTWWFFLVLPMLVWFMIYSIVDSIKNFFRR